MKVEELIDRLAQAEKELNEFVSQANQRIAFLNGRIELLKEMLNSETGTTEGKAEATPKEK